MVNRQAIVLLSGGLDSAVTLFFARDKGFRCRCLIFDYGQRHRREIASAKKVAVAAKCSFRIVKIALPWKGSALLDKKLKIPLSVRVSKCQSVKGIPSTYVPARNIIFLSFALSFAEAAGAQAIFIGAHAQDYSGYPDCRANFYRAFQKVAATGTKAGVERGGIRIFTPLLNRGKAGIIKLGHKLKVPFALTWSCYKGGKYPCGSCDSCYFRSRGFKEAGLKDPILK